MRDVPSWPASTDVTEPVVRVSHGGKDREVRSLSLIRSLPSSFHAQAIGMGGIPQATGNITWAALNDVVTAQPTAFNRGNGWPPKTRDPVNVWLGYRTASGDALAKTLTGFIKSSQGNPAADVSSSVVDRISRLDRKVTLPPLLRNMPPLTDGGPWRGVELRPTFFTDLAARAGGFNSTPAETSGCVFSAPLMGSAWPERGTLVTGLRYTDRNNASAVWGVTPWGLGISDAYLSYTPSGGSVLDRPMEITALFAFSSGEARVVIAWGGASFSLYRTTGGVYAKLSNDAGTQTICELVGAVDQVVTMRITPTGGSVTVELGDSAGRRAAGVVAKPNESANSLSSVTVHSTSAGMLIGGVQVSFPSTAWTSVNYTRSAFITPAAHNASLLASPSIIAESAKSLLEEQSKAELAAWWIDGDGALHWRNRNALVTGAPVMDLTSRDHLKSLQWEEDFAGVASSVEITGREATILQHKFPKVDLWAGSYGKIEADGTEVFEELIHPDADTDWVMVDTVANSPSGYGDYNLARGSWVGVYYFFESGTEGQAGYYASEGVNLTWAGAGIVRIDHKTYKITTTVYSVGTSGWDRAEFALQVPTKREIAGVSWRQGGEKYPLIRGFAKTDWADRRYTATAAGGIDAPVLSHDVGWWVQDPAAVQTIANLLASQTATPRPVLAGVSLVPDSRLELGDIVTLTDSDLTGIRYVCLTTGIDQTIQSNPTAWSMSADFRILSTSSL